jgi:hypothetical protein
VVERLDDDKFAVRTEAFRELQKLGSVILPELREHARSRLSTEAKSRLRKLIDAWEAGLPQNDRETRMIRAVDVLSRINSPKAKELLEHVAAGGPPVARYGAKKALEVPNESESR